MSDTMLDQYIARMQNLPVWNIYAIDDKAGGVVPWYEVTGAQAVSDLVLDEARLHEQVVTISSEIQKWGRLSALARRVWEMEERSYRSWRSKMILEQLQPEDPPTGWKKPTQAAIEATYRKDPEYDKYQRAVERAEEAYNATDAMLQGMRAKKEMLLKFAYRHGETGQPQLSV